MRTILTICIGVWRAQSTEGLHFLQWGMDGLLGSEFFKRVYRILSNSTYTHYFSVYMLSKLLESLHNEVVRNNIFDNIRNKMFLLIEQLSKFHLNKTEQRHEYLFLNITASHSNVTLANSNILTVPTSFGQYCSCILVISHLDYFVNFQNLSSYCNYLPFSIHQS